MHRLTCPHTHHQNGTIERKHRHIIEIALTLLAKVAMPFSYQDEAVATATRIINRIPPFSLQRPSPFEVLFHKPPPYSSFRVFGYTCYPFLRPYNKHKFDYHSFECVFLGYSSHHKGYRCLATDGRIYISKDVVFNETKFPFKEQGSAVSQSPPSSSHCFATFSLTTSIYVTLTLYSLLPTTS